jgi:hypothetical protein
VQRTDVEYFPVREGGDGREAAVGQDHDAPVDGRRDQQIVASWYR